MTNDSTGHQEPMMASSSSSSQPSIPDLPPPPPDPSKDANLRFDIKSPMLSPDEDENDIFKLSPTRAMQHIGAGIEALVEVTGDIPPTPPPLSPTVPNMRGMHEEKINIVRTHSERSLARLREQAEAAAVAAVAAAAAHCQGGGGGDVDGVKLRKPPLPEHATTAEAALPYIVVGENSQPVNTQHSAITRKFYSKATPPIGIADYLARLHRFCPASTAVYLATSLYIHRVAVAERAIAVTRRNVHRLVLAGLRVAMKALEDLSYPHQRVARVGGVSEAELARLEISFCFLTGFELLVDEASLKEHWENLRAGKALGALEPTTLSLAAPVGSEI